MLKYCALFLAIASFAIALTFSIPSPASPPLRGHRACAAAVNREIDRANIPWYMTGKVRSNLLRDVRNVQEGSLTIEQAGNEVYQMLRDRRVEDGWAKYLARQYRESLGRLAEGDACD